MTAQPTIAQPALAAVGTSPVGARQLRLDLHLDFGEIVALVGPNGAGKSTTFDVLLGLRTLGSGSVTVEGSVVTDTASGVRLPPPRRGLGWVPQAPALLPRHRVLEQIRPFLHPTRAPLAVHGPGALLALLHLEGLTQARPHELSGGQAQRVAVARALGAARVVLLDEATSAQDPDGAAAIRSAVRAHVAAGGACLVISHRPEDAWVLADRAVVLDELQPVQHGTAADLASRPATAYVAQVAGMTVLHGVVDEHHVLHTASGDLVVPDVIAPGTVTALVRPSAVTLHADEPHGQSARNVLACTVVAVEHGPAGLRVVLDGRPPLTAALTDAAAHDLALRPGSRVWATIKATDIEIRPR